MSCGTCIAIDLSERVRLLEQAYHEDMNDLFERLEALKRNRPFSEGPDPDTKPRPQHSIPRQQASNQLACYRCNSFMVHPDYFFCLLECSEFPSLCERYERRSEYA